MGWAKLDRCISEEVGLNPTDCTKCGRVFRQDHVMRYRRFATGFKRSIIEQLLGETASPTELCRLHGISSGQLYTWKRQYADGKLDGKPSRESELASRVRELKRLLGKVILESEFLKKAVQSNLKRTEKRESSLPRIAHEIGRPDLVRQPLLVPAFWGASKTPIEINRHNDSLAEPKADVLPISFRRFKYEALMPP